MHDPVNGISRVKRLGVALAWLAAVAGCSTETAFHPRDAAPDRTAETDLVQDVSAEVAGADALLPTDVQPDRADLTTDGADASPWPVVSTPCTQDSECGPHSAMLVHDCLDEAAWGIPGGYCTHSCELGNPSTCEPGTICAGLVPSDSSCLATCQLDSDCRPGLHCANAFANRNFDTTIEPAGQKLCVPGNPKAKYGDPCASDYDCQPGLGRCLIGYRGGYCSARCDTAPCVPDGSCAPIGRNGSGLCLKRCDPMVSDCRPDYQCVQGKDLDGTPTDFVCAPGSSTAKLGDPCKDDNDCPADALAYCYNAKDYGPAEGICFSFCAPAAGCGTGNECIDFGSGFGGCFPTCTAGTTQCRPGFQCAQGFDGVPTTATICTPGTPGPTPLGHPCKTPYDCSPGQYCSPYLNMCSSYCPPFGPWDCPAGSTCVEGGCLPSCTTDADCVAIRGTNADPSVAAYGCSASLGGFAIPGGGKVCVPYEPTANVGDPCTDFYGDCTLTGYCFQQDAKEAFPWLDGYCTESCGPTPCGAGQGCAQTAQGGMCVALCSHDSDCRAGYACALQGSMGGICLPATFPAP